MYVAEDREEVGSMPVLLVEDSIADAKLLEHAFRKTEVRNPITHLDTAQEAWDYIMNEGSYENDSSENPTPAIILLDLNMPGMDGRMLLSKIKTTPVAKRIPVIVMTTSDNPEDIDECYESGANAYIRKPAGSKRLYEVVRSIEKHWLNTALLPEL